MRERGVGQTCGLIKPIGAAGEGRVLRRIYTLFPALTATFEVGKRRVSVSAGE
jgi:hypothetical protein